MFATYMSRINLAHFIELSADLLAYTTSDDVLLDLGIFSCLHTLKGRRQVNVLFIYTKNPM